MLINLFVLFFPLIIDKRIDKESLVMGSPRLSVANKLLKPPMCSGASDHVKI